ncbi:MAG: hypothetical protein HW406_480, partial [Candidatus Brocadiaceae bacterium]|nr:hypothetical protein [Candidatus Brocadiaceae bacterium]
QRHRTCDVSVKYFYRHHIVYCDIGVFPDIVILCASGNRDWGCCGIYVLISPEYDNRGIVWF